MTKRCAKILEKENIFIKTLCIINKHLRTFLVCNYYCSRHKKIFMRFEVSST